MEQPHKDTNNVATWHIPLLHSRGKPHAPLRLRTQYPPAKSPHPGAGLYMHGPNQSLNSTLAVSAVTAIKCSGLLSSFDPLSSRIDIHWDIIHPQDVYFPSRRVPKPQLALSREYYAPVWLFIVNFNVVDLVKGTPTDAVLVLRLWAAIQEWWHTYKILHINQTSIPLYQIGPKYQPGDYKPYIEQQLLEFKKQHAQTTSGVEGHPLLQLWLEHIPPVDKVALSAAIANLNKSTTIWLWVYLCHSLKHVSYPGKGQPTSGGGDKAATNTLARVRTSIYNMFKNLATGGTLWRARHVSSPKALNDPDISVIRTVWTPHTQVNSKHVPYMNVAHHRVEDCPNQFCYCGADNAQEWPSRQTLRMMLPRHGNVIMDLEECATRAIKRQGPWLAYKRSIRGGDVLDPGTTQYLNNRSTLAQYEVMAYCVPTTRMSGKPSRVCLKILNRWYSPTSPTDNRHQTTHMASMVTNYLYPRSEQSMVDKFFPDHAPSDNIADRVRAINSVLQYCAVTIPQPLAISALLTASVPPKHPAMGALREIIRSGFYTRDRASLKQTLKAISVIMRRSQVSFAGRLLSIPELANAAYLEQHFGRSNNVSDWKNEIYNRTTDTYHIRMPKMTIKPTTVRAINGHHYPSMEMQWQDAENVAHMPDTRRDPEFYEELRKHIRDIAQVLVTKKGTRESLAHFYMRRHEWMSSGSSGGFTIPEDTGAKGEGQRSVRVGKRAWAEHTKVGIIQATMYKGRPVEHAVASEKFEQKPRAIYGVEPIHYVINTYGTMGFEEKLHKVPGLEKGLGGYRDFATQMGRAFVTSQHDQECSMLDFADFNIHHTPEAQAIIFEEFAKAGERVGAHPDWIRANTYVAQAKYNMTASFPGHAHKIKVLQGMYSGTRSTDLINTILNLAYFRVVQSWLASRGCIAHQLYHVHQGDDMWVNNTSKAWATLLYYSMNSMNFVFSPPKQMFGVGRGEYLRVLYVNGGATGYTQRALANYILRPIQNDIAQGPQTWAQTIQDATHTLCRRHMPLQQLQWLYWDATNYWIRVRAHKADTKPITPPFPLLVAPMVAGGWGCAPPGVYIHPPRNHITIPPKIEMYDKDVSSLPAHMASDWIKHVSTKSDFYPVTIDSQALEQSIKQTSYTDYLRQTGRDTGQVKWKREMSQFLNNLPREFRSVGMLRPEEHKLWNSFNRIGNSLDYFFTTSDNEASIWDRTYINRGQPLPVFPTPDGHNLDTARTRVFESTCLWGTTFTTKQGLEDICCIPHPESNPVPLDSAYGDVIYRARSGQLEGEGAYPTISATQRMVAGSKYKSDSTLSLAAHISKMDAMRLIVQESVHNRKVNEDALNTLVDIIRDGNNVALDIITAGVTLPEAALKFYNNATATDALLNDIICLKLKVRPTKPTQNTMEWYRDYLNSMNRCYQSMYAASSVSPSKILF